MTLIGVDWLFLAFWGAVVMFLASVIALLAAIGAGIAHWRDRKYWRDDRVGGEGLDKHSE